MNGSSWWMRREVFLCLFYHIWTPWNVWVLTSVVKLQRSLIRKAHTSALVSLKSAWLVWAGLKSIIQDLRSSFHLVLAKRDASISLWFQILFPSLPEKHSKKRLHRLCNSRLRFRNLWFRREEKGESTVQKSKLKLDKFKQTFNEKGLSPLEPLILPCGLLLNSSDLFLRDTQMFLRFQTVIWIVPISKSCQSKELLLLTGVLQRH